MKKILVIVAFLSIFVFGIVFTYAKADGTADKPPMGYNTFHDVSCSPDEATVKARVDATVTSGMKDAGYVYINIDDGWLEKTRDSNGDIRPNLSIFPSGMKALTDYIHSKGLKAGIYLTCGLRTYADLAGSLGYEQKDADKIAEWGFDFLKYDYRVLPEDPANRNAKNENITMSNALKNNKYGRKIAFNMCEHGRTEPWTWAGEYSHMWRVSTDVKDIWEGEFQGGWSFNKIIDERVSKAGKYNAPGQYNDYDMLVIGLKGKHYWMGSGLTPTEYRSQFSMLSMLGAPLVHGIDPSKMDQDTKDILLNKEVIAIDQDSLCLSAQKVKSENGLEYWVKKLSDHSLALALYNRSSSKQNMSIQWRELGLDENTTMQIRDLWNHSDIGALNKGLSRAVMSHECAVLKLSPSLNTGSYNPGNILFDFENTVEDWKGSNLSVNGGPFYTNEWKASGSYSLKADISMSGNSKHYLVKSKELDLSNKSSLKVTVKHAPWGNVAGGMKAKLYVKTGDGYQWFDSGEKLIDSGNNSTEITLDLSKVSNKNRIRELGVEFIADPSSSGNTSVYIDSVTCPSSF